MRRESTPTLFLLLLVLVRPAVGFFIQLQPSPSIVDRSTLLTFLGDDGENWGGRTSSSNSRRRRGALCSRTLNKGLPNNRDPSNTAVEIESLSMPPSSSPLSPSPFMSSTTATTAVPKAPLVDSALLRFISEQRVGTTSTDEVPLPTTSVPSGEESVVLKASVVSPFNKGTEIVKPSPLAGIVEDEFSRTSSNNSIPISANLQDGDGADLRVSDSKSWTLDMEETAEVNVLGQDELSSMLAAPFSLIFPTYDEAAARRLSQYNAHSVSQKLMSIGAENDISIEAGLAVQQYALNRTMRRSVQRFLRERDALWTNGTPQVNTTRAMSYAPMAEDKTAIDRFHESSGIDAIIDVLTSAGLTGKDVASILIHTPSVSTMLPGTNETTINEDSGPSSSRRGSTLNETLGRAYFGLLSRTLKLRRYDARKVLRTCPGLLTKQGSKSAEEIVTLLSSLGVSASSLAREKSSLPRLLSRSPAAIFRLAVFLSSESVRMSTKQIGSFLRRPGSSSLLDAVDPPTSLSQSQSFEASECNLFVNDLGESHVQSRQVVGSTYRKMANMAAVLYRRVGVRNLSGMISANPDVLLLEVSHIMPIVQYLEEIGIDEEDVPLVLQTYPALVEADLVELQRVVNYMRSLGVEDAALGGIFRAFPSIFSLDVEKEMTPVVSFLRGIGVVNIGRFITRLPPVLGYSVEKDLRPKWEYLSQVCDFDYFEVVRFPAFFSYPLDRVIKTRYEYLRDSKRIPASLVSVDDVLRYGDIDFAVKVAGDTDGGKAFVNFAKKRNKRSSRKKAPSRRNRQRGSSRQASCFDERV